MNNNKPVTYMEKMTIAVLSCILLAVLSYRIYIYHDLQKIDSLVLEYDTLQMTLQLLNNKLSEADALDSEEILKDYLLEYENASKDIFPFMNTENICQNVSDLFLKRYIDITSISANEPQLFIAYDEENDVVFQSDNIYISRLNVSSCGKFKDILSVIDDINAHSAYVIENIDISENNDGTAVFNLVIDVFMYDDSLINLED